MLSSPALRAAPAKAETWETGYSGTDATGSHVLGYWKFDGANSEAALRDASGHGRNLTLVGGVLKTEGKFSGALEGFPGFPVQDKRHAATTTATRELSPGGAFTLEMWITTKPEHQNLRCYLLDKKYVDHSDFQWQLGEADKSGQRRMSVIIGFGTESRTFNSEPAKFAPGVWRHIAFTYDAEGEGRFYVDGESAGSQKHDGFGAPRPGNKPLSIGDRIGSNYGGFPGFIDEVRVCRGVLKFEPVELEIASARTVWQRMEKAEAIEVRCTNLRRQPLVGAKLTWSWPGVATETVTLPELAPGATHTAKFVVNTALRADEYDCRARLELTQPRPLVTERRAKFTIVARPLANRMPVIMWGIGASAVEKEAARLKDIGFTHCLGMGADYGSIWKSGKVTEPDSSEGVAGTRRILDLALKNDLGLVSNLSPGRWLESNPKNLRVGRDGKPYTREDICASMPEFAPFFENVGASVAKAYGDHPAFSMALIDTEVRDASQPSFNEVDVQNYRAFSGGDIPAEVSYRGGVEWGKLKGFPKDRVIPNDHPILKYYRWYWTVGDGWNGLHSALNNGLKKFAHPGFQTFYDPAVRQPSISMSGGNVDVLSHWTYTYPDPQKIGLCADQLFAMSAASGLNQQVMKMTQLIWYRSQTAPIKAGANQTPASPGAWDDHDPDAAYITIAPMHLREALWTKLARPIRGIMYHGWQSLVETDSTSAYRFTNPHTQHELKRLIHDVVEPLGPTLLQVPDTRSKVAFLESFTSQMFARRGGYGYNPGGAADVWLALQHAHVQCDILFEETLLKDGLDGRTILVMPDCDVLTASVVKKIADWQKRGGKIIADAYLCPALKAELVLPSIKRIKKADEDKAQLLKLAGQIRAALPKLGFKPGIDCDNPEIVLRTRRYGDATYVFAINDHREAGSYVGRFGLVMENGLPSKGTLTLSGNSHVYDLTEETAMTPNGNSLPIQLGPCDGKVLLMLPEEIGKLSIQTPASVKTGSQVTLKVALVTAGGKSLRAVVPAVVEMRDPNGRLAEGSGYYGIKDGTLSVRLDLAPNDDPGTWQITARELASRKTATAYFTVQP